jgi:predicted aspartyl protease
MIKGIVTPNRQARIDLTVFGPSRQRHAVDALVDTGFNLFLTLPASTIAALALPFALRTQASLADGSLVQLECYRAAVDWNGQARDILVVSKEELHRVSGGKCAKCQVEIDLDDGEGDHYPLPHRDGGPTTIENGRFLCKSCNRPGRPKLEALT